MTPCSQVVKLCAYPGGANCLSAGAPIDFTGYVTNCGDINLTNVTVVDTRAGTLLTPGGLGLLQPFNLPVGGAVAFKGSFTPTSAEICAGSAASIITVRGTDTTVIGGPNASVTNSVTGSCSICPVVCAPVLTNPRITAGQFNVSFVTTPARTNIVEYTDSLWPPNWQTLTNFLGDGAARTITDPVANRERYYRVLIK